MMFLVRIGGNSAPSRGVHDRKGKMAAEVLTRDRGERKATMHASVRATPFSNTTMRQGEGIHAASIAD